jgi:hypothetical protein
MPVSSDAIEAGNDTVDKRRATPWQSGRRRGNRTLSTNKTALAGCLWQLRGGGFGPGRIFWIGVACGLLAMGLTVGELMALLRD